MFAPLINALIGWYEWYPDYAYDFPRITFSVGDSVTLTVTAHTRTSGTATITNNSNGVSVTKTITSSYTLCEEDAEWIVEDFDEGSSLAPFANFGTITFTNAEAITNTGTIVYPTSGTVVEQVASDGQAITRVSASGSSLGVSYV